MHSYLPAKFSNRSAAKINTFGDKKRTRRRFSHVLGNQYAFRERSILHITFDPYLCACGVELSERPSVMLRFVTARHDHVKTKQILPCWCLFREIKDELLPRSARTIDVAGAHRHLSPPVAPQLDRYIAHFVVWLLRLLLFDLHHQQHVHPITSSLCRSPATIGLGRQLSAKTWKCKGFSYPFWKFVRVGVIVIAWFVVRKPVNWVLRVIRHFQP
jgi:hypothetical protein